MSERRFKVAYLVCHPIQYQAPLLRFIARDPSIELKVFFTSTVSVKQFKDPGFGIEVRWDVDLLGDYAYEFLPAWGRTDTVANGRPFNYGLMKKLRAGGFDALWIHGYARWFHDLAMIEARLCGVKVLLRDEATPISAVRGLMKRQFKRLYFSVLTRFVDGYLAIGTLNSRYYQGYGVPDSRIFKMPYSVDNSFFQDKARKATPSREKLRSELRLERGRPIILFASKLTSRKRPDELLEAYRLLSTDGKKEPAPYLLFVGDGELRGSIEQKAKEMGWSSIRILGFKNQTELPSFYDLCDIFVLPSVNEPWGLVINEAMNSSRAVIVSDQVGCGPDLVRHGENGFIYQSGRLEELAACLKATSDPALMHSMGEASLRIISEWSFDQDLEGFKRALRTLVPRG